jgi:Icc-related predicted phosphoesterase
MPVAAVYDIHGNLPALQAVLGEIRCEDVDQVVIGGDALPGPMPVECLELLTTLEIPTHFIMGNGDREVLARMRGVETNWYKTARPEWREPIDWTAEQLRPEHEKMFANWPSTLSLPVDGLGEVLFCHATPRNDTDIFTKLTAEERLRAVFAGVKEELVICGHTHMQFDRRVGKTRVVNAGSLGMPFGKTGAAWLMLGPGIELRHTDYDLQLAAEWILRTSYPQAEEFVEKYVLNAPSEEHILQAYSKAELK